MSDFLCETCKATVCPGTPKFEGGVCVCREVPVNIADHDPAGWGDFPIDTEPSQPDMKYDQGKTDMSLLFEYFPNALDAVCRASMNGCEKYRRGSFTEVANARQRYTAGMLRHLGKECPRPGGTEITEDQDSGLPHDFHVAWNALCRLELRLMGYKWGEN